MGCGIRLECGKVIPGWKKPKHFDSWKPKQFDWWPQMPDGDRRCGYHRRGECRRRRGGLCDLEEVRQLTASVGGRMRGIWGSVAAAGTHLALPTSGSHDENPLTWGIAGEMDRGGIVQETQVRRVSVSGLLILLEALTEESGLTLWV